MIWNGIPAEKVMVNPMGVDTGIFKPRITVPTKPRFIAVGTICLRKGHQYLFRAFELVKRELPGAELICAGNVKADFRKEWPKWQGTFTHIPHLPQLELAKLLQTCTAFVFPSQEEGIARAQIEALAAGLPLVFGTHERQGHYAGARRRGRSHHPGTRPATDRRCHAPRGAGFRTVPAHGRGGASEGAR